MACPTLIALEHDALHRYLQIIFLSFFLLLLLAPSVWNNISTNPRGAQALSKEFPASAPCVIQGENRGKSPSPMAPRYCLQPVGLEP